ncbi:uncharacterized protein LOC116455523 isoform X1 [Corvus moneduloides]|uniref:uncharacterized protein LOC116455523 isoform X1 n=1 Tax=Corvus moneduloides TaxID=1196302 RepID=UPI0013621532|nr:uncharacterized protein LOC116455523 isoform X1 [Corvus moneduloides]XP_031989365.1 uncharacterized protein LOC116455523 isoform X1 [Corvus moneduloides]
MRARGADEGAGKASPAAWLHEDLQPLESPAGVSAGRAFPAPFLVDARKTSSHRRGPPRGRNKPRGVKMSLEKSKHRDQMLSGLERRREMEAEAVLKAVLPGGSSGSLAASAAGREAMPGTGTGDWDRDLHHLESLVNDGLRILELDGSEAVDEDDLDSQPEPPEEDEDEEGRSRPFPWESCQLRAQRWPAGHRCRCQDTAVPVCALALRHPLPAPAAQCCPCRSAEMTEASLAVELQVCLQGGLLQLLCWFLHASPAPIAGVSSESLLTPQAEHWFCGIHSSEMELLSLKVLQEGGTNLEETLSPWRHPYNWTKP